MQIKNCLRIVTRNFLRIADIFGGGRRDSFGGFGKPENVYGWLHVKKAELETVDMTTVY